MGLNNKYFLNPAHLDLARSRFFLKDENGIPIENDIEESFERVVGYIYKDDKDHAEEALRFRKEKKIIDGGRPLAQAGTKTKNLFSCFVLGFEDDTREAISELKRAHFNIQASGGGVGTNFSTLRPKGSICKSTQSRSSGSTGFITDLSHQSHNIQQSGSRSGANMGVLEDWHPDLYEFITKKSNSNWENVRKFTTVFDEDEFAYFQWNNPHIWQMFNVSVFISDDFMLRVINNDKNPWVLKWKDVPWHLWEFKNTVGPSSGKKYEKTIIVTAPSEDMARHKASTEIPFGNKQFLELIRGPYDLTAKEWYHLICKNSWEDGCPGVIFIDTVRKYHNGEYFNPISATNPCFSGDTMVAVADGRGAVAIKQLAEEGVDVPVYSLNRHGKVEIKWGRYPRLTRRNAELVRVTLDDGTFLDVTPDHGFMLRDGTKKEASDLVKGDSLPRLLKNPEKISENNDKKYLRMYCDTLDCRSDKIFEHRLISKFYNEDKWNKLYDSSKSNGWSKGGVVVHHKDYNPLNNKPENLEIMTFSEHSKFHGKVDNRGSKNSMYGKKHSEETKRKIGDKTKERCEDPEYKERLVQSLKDAVTDERREKNRKSQQKRNIENWKKIEKETDYNTVWIDQHLHVEKNCKQCKCEIVVPWGKRATVFCSKECLSEWGKKFSKDMLCKAREVLQDKQKKTFHNQIDIYNNLKIDLGRDPFKKEWEDKCRENKVSFRLRPKINGNYIFSSYKQLKETAKQYNHKVVKVEKLDKKEDVYNITVDDNHTVGIVTDFDVGSCRCSGVYVFQCAEEPLPVGGVCALTSIILPTYYDSENDEFDWDEFGRAIYQAVRGLDNIITINETGEKFIDDNSLNERRVGLGTTGIAELLILKKLKYSSVAGRKFTEEILEFLRDRAYEASIELAKERGTFPAYSYNGVSKSEFFKTLPENIRNKIKRYGLRNVTVLTQAPNGSIGTMVGFSTGCEPYFAMNYLRNTKVGSFSDGSPAFRDWLKENNINYEDHGYNLQKLKETIKVPEYFEEAHNISWKDHLKMQAIFSKYIDASISKTINMPNSATIEDIENAYIEAYKMGIKCTTIYRDGSKKQILEHIKSKSAKQRPQSVTRAHSPKRPEELECDISHTSVKGEKWTVLVGLLEGVPYELFCAPQESFEISDKYKKGKLVKNGKGSYCLDLEDFKLKNISSYLDTDEHRIITRLISTCLRHGVPMKYISEQLTKVNGTVVDFSKAILRVLKKYDDKDLHSSKDMVCFNCGGTNMVLNSGCPECLDCGASKCG
jgi:ribonucleotide reductase alpha subunit